MRAGVVISPSPYAAGRSQTENRAGFRRPPYRRRPTCAPARGRSFTETFSVRGAAVAGPEAPQACGRFPAPFIDARTPNRAVRHGSGRPEALEGRTPSPGLPSPEVDAGAPPAVESDSGGLDESDESLRTYRLSQDDRLPKRLEREWTFLSAPFGSLPSKRLLDLGCGTGEHARYLAEKGSTSSASTWSDTMLERAREDGVPAGVQFLKAISSTSNRWFRQVRRRRLPREHAGARHGIRRRFTSCSGRCARSCARRAALTRC